MRVMVALAAILVCATAQAGWRSTEWGMSEHDALAVSPTLRAVDGVPLLNGALKVWLAGKHEIAGEAFEASLAFDANTGGLALVNLEPEDEGACHKALVALQGKGSADVERSAPGMEIMVWRFPDENNVVWYRGNMALRQYSNREPECRIQYRPLKGRDEGL